MDGENLFLRHSFSLKYLNNNTDRAVKSLIFILEDVTLFSWMYDGDWSIIFSMTTLRRPLQLPCWLCFPLQSPNSHHWPSHLPPLLHQHSHPLLQLWQQFHFEHFLLSLILVLVIKAFHFRYDLGKQCLRRDFLQNFIFENWQTVSVEWPIRINFSMILNKFLSIFAFSISERPILRKHIVPLPDTFMENLLIS